MVVGSWPGIKLWSWLGSIPKESLSSTAKKLFVPGSKSRQAFPEPWQQSAEGWRNSRRFPSGSLYQRGLRYCIFYLSQLWRYYFRTTSSQLKTKSLCEIPELQSVRKKAPETSAKKWFLGLRWSKGFWSSGASNRHDYSPLQSRQPFRIMLWVLQITPTLEARLSSTIGIPDRHLGPVSWCHLCGWLAQLQKLLYFIMALGEKENPSWIWVGSVALNWTMYWAGLSKDNEKYFKHKVNRWKK